jgi:PAS domain-containing protein
LAPLLLAGMAAASLGLFLTRQLRALTGFARAFAVVVDRSPDPVPKSTVTEFEALRVSLSRAEAVLRRRGAAEKIALREARTGQELLASVVNGTAEGICVKDLDGRYVLVNSPGQSAAAASSGTDAIRRKPR